MGFVQAHHEQRVSVDEIAELFVRSDGTGISVGEQRNKVQDLAVPLYGTLQIADPERHLRVSTEGGCGRHAGELAWAGTSAPVSPSGKP